MKVFINPSFDNVDNADGGIRRVVEAQRKYLPKIGVEVVGSYEEADVLACHAGLYVNTTKPIVSHTHGLYWDEYEWQKWSIDLNRDVIESLRCADEVTAPSEWVARILRHGMWLTPTVLYHGVEPNDWLPGGNEGYVLWNKTRTDPVCDPNPMIDLAKQRGGIPFVSTFGPNNIGNIRVTGPKPFHEGKQFVRNAAVYLATSRETFGIGTIEAMACGVPVLGWDWGGQSEFVGHRVSGWLARPGDIDGLAEGLDFVLAHRDELGQAARQRVLDEFTWERAIARYVPVYERAIGARSSGVKVSIVVPAYNMQSTLAETIESVGKQHDFKDSYEIVIVNDASTDGTGALADTMAATDSHIRVIHHTENQYLAATLNDGIAAARGEYIVPLDADNMLGEAALGVLTKSLDGDRSLDIVYGAMNVIEPDGREWTSTWPQQFDYYLQMMHHNQITSTSMYRKRIWERVGGYRIRCRTAEDADFWCRATSYGARPKRVSDVIVLRYRNRPDSMSHVEQDWDWTAWYSWSRDRVLTPFGAAVPKAETPGIPTYEPPLVAVVIPVGPGHAKYLPDALDSIAGQTMQKWEVVVVNDSGGPLGWVPPFVKVITTTPEGGVGPARARNLGIAASKASTILPLDADDYLQPSALMELLQIYKDNDGERFVYSDWVYQETGEVKEADDYECEAVLRKAIHSVTSLYPRRAWQEVGGFDETITAWEDWDFSIALAARGYCGVRVPLPLLQYRYNSGTRRDQMYMERAEHQETILNKWADYIVGGKELMACRSCGQARSTPAIPSGAAANAAENPWLASAEMPNGAMVLLEFTGDLSGTTTFRGPVTGTPYRFGPDDRLRYVHEADSESFVARGNFRRGREQTMKEPLLAAAGPPIRK